MSRMNEEMRQYKANVRGHHHSKGDTYEAGNHWVVCDSCGFDIRASDIKETWDHRLVCLADYEPRHPQDFVRSKHDDMSAKGPVRPDPDPIYIHRGCSDTEAISGIAIVGIAIAGTGECRWITSTVPTSTFNLNTL